MATRKTIVEATSKIIGQKEVSIIPEDLKTQPSFFYNFNSGEISCIYEGSEAVSYTHLTLPTKVRV